MNINPLYHLIHNRAMKNASEYRQVLREVIQKLCLLGLWRGGFFEHAAFYGGTALRLFYGQQRFSEDLDFSLLQPMTDFRLEAYLDYVRRELEAWGIHAQTNVSIKQDSNIESAFVKAKTLYTLIDLQIPKSELKGLHRDEVSSVKFELDPNPPCEFKSDSIFLLEPIPFSIRVMSPEDLFAGKMHAVLARGWLSRIKGRDWYDLIWFVKRGIVCKLSHLEARLRQSGHYTVSVSLDASMFRDLLRDRINKVDFEQAKKDVLPFIPHPNELDNWSRELFLSLVDRIKLSDTVPSNS